MRAGRAANIRTKIAEEKKKLIVARSIGRKRMALPASEVDLPTVLHPARVAAWRQAQGGNFFFLLNICIFSNRHTGSK